LLYFVQWVTKLSVSLCVFCALQRHGDIVGLQSANCWLPLIDSGADVRYVRTACQLDGRGLMRMAGSKRCEDQISGLAWMIWRRLMIKLIWRLVHDTCNRDAARQGTRHSFALLPPIISPAPHGSGGCWIASSVVNTQPSRARKMDTMRAPSLKGVGTKRYRFECLGRVHEFAS
jgi:hypothetical protein